MLASSKATGKLARHLATKGRYSSPALFDSILRDLTEARSGVESLLAEALVALAVEDVRDLKPADLPMIAEEAGKLDFLETFAAWMLNRRPDLQTALRDMAAKA